MLVRFQEVSLTGRKAVRCTDCGKVLRRQKKVWQTLNPVNRREDGNPKTEGEIRWELIKKLDDWKRQPETCRKCDETQKAAP